MESTVDLVDANRTTPTTTTSRWPFRCNCQVNKDLVLLKVSYFLFFGSLTGIAVPMILYCQQLGMSLSMVGVLFAVLPFVQLISKPIAGSIADKFAAHKTVLLFSVGLMAVSLFSARFIPKANLNSKMQITSRSSNGTIADEHRLKWTPEDVASVECFPGGPIHVKVCDYLRDNDSTLSLQLLAPATVGCNLTCSPTEFDQIQRLFCMGAGDADCLFRKKYSFYDAEDKDNRNHVNLMVEIKPTLTTSNVHNISSDENLGASDLFCSALAVSNITITDILFPSMHLRMATAATCPSNVHSLFRCPGVCTTTYNASSDLSSTGGSSTPDLTLQFAWIWVSCVLGWAAYGATLSIMDTIIVVTLGEEKRGDYGKTRLFGSIGWGVLSPFTAYLIDLASKGKPESDLTPAFYVFLALITIKLVVNLFIKVPAFIQPEKLAKDVFRLFASSEVIIFALSVYLVGVTTGFLWTFLVVYANELNGTQLIIGLNYAVECLLSEVPFFAVSGWLLARIGHGHAMTFVLLISGLKCIIYSLLTNAWYMLCVALIHGVTYGLLYGTLASFAGRIAPEGGAATLQGIFQGIFEGAGIGTGNLIGGVAYDHFGGRKTMRLFGLATLGVAVAHLLINCIVPRMAGSQNDVDSVASKVKPNNYGTEIKQTSNTPL